MIVVIYKRLPKYRKVTKNIEKLPVLNALGNPCFFYFYYKCNSNSTIIYYY